MGLTKDVLVNYQKALLGDRERLLSHLNVTIGQLETVGRLLSIVEAEERGEVVDAEQVLGILKK